jgi:hypothetical protein
MPFGAAMLDFLLILHRPSGIEAPVGLECRLVMLQSVEKGKNGRFVIRRADFADAHLMV